MSVFISAFVHILYTLLFCRLLFLTSLGFVRTLLECSEDSVRRLRLHQLIMQVRTIQSTVVTFREEAVAGVWLWRIPVFLIFRSCASLGLGSYTLCVHFRQLPCTETSKVPKTMAEYPKTGSIGSRGSISLGILEVHRDPEPLHHIKAQQHTEIQSLHGPLFPYWWTLLQDPFRRIV